MKRRRLKSDHPRTLDTFVDAVFHATRPADPLAEAQRWIAERDKQRDEHLARLLAELAGAREQVATLHGRIAQIEGAIAALNAERRSGALTADDELLLSARDTDLNLSDAKDSEALEWALAAHDNGATAAELNAWIRARGRAIKSKVVHTYLHRMLQDKRALAHEVIGQPRRYRPGPRLLNRTAKEGSMPSG